MNTIMSYFDVDTIKNAQQHLAWSCCLYKVLVPIKKKSVVNIFEETILRLISERLDKIEDLHQATGLPENFILLIVKKLQAQRLIDNQLKLTNKGKETISLIEDISTQNDMAVIGLLMEKTKGELLDIIDYENSSKKLFVEESSSQGFKVFFGTSGKAENIYLEKIYGNYHTKKNLSVLDIKSIFKNFKNRVFENNKDFEQYILHSSFNDIKIIGEPEIVYLHCAIYFDENSNFIYVKDGIGYSKTLTNLLPNPIKQKVRKNLLIDKSNGERNDNNIHNDIIIDNIKNIHRLYQKIEEFKESNAHLNKLKKNIENKRELLKLLYDTIEHALAYLHQIRPFDEWGSYIKPDYDKNYQNLKKILVDEYKLNDTKDMQKMLSYFSKVNYGQINSLSFGNISLMPLLVKAIYASQVLDDYVFMDLLKKNPSIFDYFSQLHYFRNSVSHGDDINNLTFEQVSHVYHSGIDIIMNLYPRLISKSSDILKSNDDLSQKYLKAEIRLDKYFDNHVPDMVRHNLFRLFELDYELKRIDGKEREMIVASEKLKFIQHLSSSTEKSLQFHIKYLMTKDDKHAIYYAADFQEWLAKKNLTMNKSISKKLQNMNQSKIRKMYERLDKYALLDLFIFYLFLSMQYDETALLTLLNQEVDIADIIGTLHTFRGHVNEITNEFDKISDEELVKFQKQVFLIIKVLIQSY